jgi:hypothetical protein
MGGKRIYNLAPGENDNDAVTYKQLLDNMFLLNDFNEDLA